MKLWNRIYVGIVNINMYEFLRISIHSKNKPMEAILCESNVASLNIKIYSTTFRLFFFGGGEHT